MTLLLAMTTNGAVIRGFKENGGKAENAEKERGGQPPLLTVFTK